jgi:hypothetical protein
MNREDLSRCIEAIEKSYEFFLAYAAQGTSREAAEGSDAQVRESLEQTEAALHELEGGLAGLVEAESLEPAMPYREMIEVTVRDARHAATAVRLALAQPAIGSELIDNLNASSHVRALLTDLFLLDEVV